MDDLKFTPVWDEPDRDNSREYWTYTVELHDVTLIDQMDVMIRIGQDPLEGAKKEFATRLARLFDLSERLR